MVSACCSCCSTLFAPCLPYPNLPMCKPATLTATQLLSSFLAIIVAVACTSVLPSTQLLSSSLAHTEAVACFPVLPSLLTCASLCHPVQTLFLRAPPLPNLTLALRRHAGCTGMGRRNDSHLRPQRALQLPASC